jgi:probable rRNA maturation factor
VAAQQAPSHAGTLDDEIALLLVHGILHVLGYDHDVEEATTRMRQREKHILERHHWNGPAPAQFRQEHSE